MAKPTGAAAKALEKKALAAESKSEGMRMLFEAGYEAAEIRTIFDVAYGFVYGVGVRGGFISPSKREAKPKTTKTKAAAPKATATKTKAAPRAKASEARSRAAAKRTRAKA